MRKRIIALILLLNMAALASYSQSRHDTFNKLDPAEYEILKTDYDHSVLNFAVLLKRGNFDKNYVYQFIDAFRKEKCKVNCNIDVYDSKAIVPLIDVDPLEGEEYLKMADHLVSISTFDEPETHNWYPYQDTHYKELGGKNWKKEPVE